MAPFFFCTSRMLLRNWDTGTCCAISLYIIDASSQLFGAQQEDSNLDGRGYLFLFVLWNYVACYVYHYPFLNYPFSLPKAIYV